MSLGVARPSARALDRFGLTEAVDPKRDALTGELALLLDLAAKLEPSDSLLVAGQDGVLEKPDARSESPGRRSR